jgi:hypothetical protein
VHVLDDDERARAEHHGAEHAQVEPALGAARAARRARDEAERQRGEQRAREARRIVQRHHALQQPCEAGRDRRVERRLLHEGLAGVGRHDEVAGLQHVLDDAERIGFVLLPRIVAHYAGQQVRSRQCRDQQPRAPGQPQRAVAGRVGDAHGHRHGRSRGAAATPDGEPAV